MDLKPSSTPGSAAPDLRRILIVSREAQELDAIRAGLEDMRSKWELTAVREAGAALGAMREAAFDAAIVDLQEPTSQGLALLKDIMEQAPDTLRIALTSAQDRPAIQEVGAPAHQLLSKPCDAKVLKAVLARAFAARNFVGDDGFKKLVAGMTSLPVLPQAYNEIMKELQSRDSSLERVGEIVARDMGLTAKILQLVNSAFFGLSRSIAHPAEAAIFLGSETLKAMVLSLQVFSQYQNLKLTECTVELLWRHSWTTGVLAKRLCEHEKAPRDVGDEAFIGGLLHDVGKLVWAANDPAGFEDSLRQARLNKVPLWEQEFALRGSSHAELGGYLLGSWGLPQGVVEAVAFHHRPAQARRQSFCALTAVHAANTLGKVQGGSCRAVAQAVDEDYLRSLGLGDRIEHWKSFFTESTDRGD